MPQTLKKADPTKPNPLGTEKISKLLFRFSLPSIIAMLVSSLYNIVDQIFIGQGLGYLGNGATTVAFPLSTFCLAITLLLGVGAASCYSLRLGEGDRKTAAYCIGSSLSFSLLAGLAILILGELFLPWLLPVFGATSENIGLAIEYSRIILIGFPVLIIENVISQVCRADGSPNFSMAFMVAGAIVNCILDPLFIFVFNWGMSGAAWATVIGQFVSLAIALFYLPHFKQVKLSRDDFKIRWSVLGKCCELGLSSALNQAALLAVQITVNNLFKHYGALSIYGSNIPIAASGVAFKLNGLYVSLMVGLSQGLQPIVGFNYGAGKYERVKKCMKLAMVSMVILGCMVEAIFQLFPEQLLSLFGAGDDLYIRFGVLMLRVYFACIGIQGIVQLSSTYFAAIGQPPKGIFLSLSRSIIYFMPLVFLFSSLWGIDGQICAQPIADFLAVITSLILDTKSFKKMNELERVHKLAPETF